MCLLVLEWIFVSWNYSNKYDVLAIAIISEIFETWNSTLMTFLNNFEFIIDLLFLLTLLIFSMKYFHIHFTTDLWKICDKTGNQVSIVSRNGQYWYIVSTPGLGKHQLETKINYRHKSISETKQRFETFQNFIKC